MSIWNNRVQLTVGVRHQYVESESFAMGTGVRTGGYDASATTPAYALVIKPLENVSVYANYIEALETGSIVGEDMQMPDRCCRPIARRSTKWASRSIGDGSRPRSAPSTSCADPARRSLRRNTCARREAKVRNRGVEINTFGEVTEGVRLLGGVMFLDARQQKTERRDL
jgi:iron complex outermembrane receptor protein